MKLIEEWRKSYKLTSIQTSVLLVVVNGLVATMPVLSSKMSLPVYAGIMAFCNIGVGVLRLVAQPKTKV